MNDTMGDSGDNLNKNINEEMMEMSEFFDESVLQQLDEPFERLDSSMLRSETRFLGFDDNMGDTWIYPTNLPVREYQFNIVRNALFRNTLVVLPTGLGKTFIAAVVMYNMYRWYPGGKIIFMAPTRPLVAQQIEACFKIMGIPKEDTVEITGRQAKSARLQLWQTKRVFFATPQTVLSDLSESNDQSFPVQDVKLIVVDEAHKAKGKYAYTNVLRLISERNCYFRILALSATPGRKIEDVVEIVRNLFISHIEVRSESSVDVYPYTFKKNIKTVVVSLDERLTRIREQFIIILDPYVRHLLENNVITGSVGRMNKNWLVMEQKRFREMSVRTRHPNHTSITSNFSMAISMYHALELLDRHGIRVFLNYFEDNSNKSEQKFCVTKDGRLKNFLNHLREEVGPNPFAVSDQTLPDCSIPDVPDNLDFGHPKYRILQKYILEHFEKSKDSRAIIFCEFRESVYLLHRLLLANRPMIAPRVFVGQKSAAGGGGGVADGKVTQKQQIAVMEEFKKGKCNTLIATCIAEEGIDVGEVDLIICFDISTTNPTRFVQRIGRTGRKKNGQVLMLATAGREHEILKEVMATKNKTNHKLTTSADIVRALYPKSPRMVPPEFAPKCLKLHIAIENSPKPLKFEKHKKPLPSKSETLSKRPPQTPPNKSKSLSKRPPRPPAKLNVPKCGVAIICPPAKIQDLIHDSVCPTFLQKYALKNNANFIRERFASEMVYAVLQQENCNDLQMYDNDTITFMKDIEAIDRIFGGRQLVIDFLLHDRWQINTVTPSAHICQLNKFIETLANTNDDPKNVNQLAANRKKIEMTLSQYTDNVNLSLRTHSPNSDGYFLNFENDIHPVYASRDAELRTVNCVADNGNCETLKLLLARESCTPKFDQNIVESSLSPVRPTVAVVNAINSPHTKLTSINRISDRIISEAERETALKYFLLDSIDDLFASANAICAKLNEFAYVERRSRDNKSNTSSSRNGRNGEIINGHNNMRTGDCSTPVKVVPAKSFKDFSSYFMDDDIFADELKSFKSIEESRQPVKAIQVNATFSDAQTAVAEVGVARIVDTSWNRKATASSSRYSIETKPDDFLMSTVTTMHSSCSGDGAGAVSRSYSSVNLSKAAMNATAAATATTAENNLKFDFGELDDIFVSDAESLHDTIEVPSTSQSKENRSDCAENSAFVDFTLDTAIKEFTRKVQDGSLALPYRKSMSPQSVGPIEQITSPSVLCGRINFSRLQQRNVGTRLAGNDDTTIVSAVSTQSRSPFFQMDATKASVTIKSDKAQTMNSECNLNETVIRRPVVRQKNRKRILSSSDSGSNSDSFISSRCINPNNSDNSEQLFETCRTSIRYSENSNNVANSRRIVVPTRKRKKHCGANRFLDYEVTVSGNESSGGDDYETSNILNNSIVASQEETDHPDVDMKAIYLQSIRDPIKRDGFKMMANNNRFDMLTNTPINRRQNVDLLSQYEEDSFIVHNDELDDGADVDHEPCVLERAEAKLKAERRRAKRAVAVVVADSVPAPVVDATKRTAKSLVMPEKGKQDAKETKQKDRDDSDDDEEDIFE